jgi:hypothetical protein
MTVTVNAPMPMGQRESTGVKSYTAPGAPVPAPAPANVNVSALRNQKWRQRKKLKMQQVEEELANAELEREQLKKEQTMLHEKLTVLLNNHQHQHHVPVPSLGLGWSHHVPPMTNQSFFAVQAAAYGPGSLPPHVRNTAQTPAPAPAVDHAVNSMLRSYRQQRKQEDEQNMRFASTIVAQEQVFKNRYMCKSNCQQYGYYGGRAPPPAAAAGPSNLVLPQEYRAAVAAQPLRGIDALYRGQLIAPPQQQQLSNKSTIITPTPSLIMIAPKKNIKTMSAILAKKKTAKEQDGNIKMLKPPRKPLSAYNFFFQDERAKLLGSQIIEEEHDDPRERKKRRYRKAHGKIGFTQLAKHVAQLWRTRDAGTKKIYDMKFQQAKKRHAAELAEYEAQLGKMIHLAQVKKALNKIKAQQAERCNSRNVVEEAKLLELQDTYRKGKAALEEQHDSKQELLGPQQLVREKV